MLFAKISPPCTVSVQTTPFQSDTIIGEWMTAYCMVYALGQEFTTFNVIFGNLSILTQQDIQQGASPIPTFTSIYSIRLTFTAQQLASWGTNDEVALEIIAQALNTTITEFLNIPEITSV